VTTDSDSARASSFGQDYRLSFIDRLGTWLTFRKLARSAGGFTGKRVMDVGCGFDARFARSIEKTDVQLTVVDVALADDLKASSTIRTIEGSLPSVLLDESSASQDVVLCTSVLEHVWEDLATLAEFRRLVAPGGTVIVNVPSWLGKRALEMSAFKLGLSPGAEMDDHKRYYDPRDLWPLLIRAGFTPHLVRCRRHKLGLNTLSVCRVPKTGVVQ